MSDRIVVIALLALHVVAASMAVSVVYYCSGRECDHLVSEEQGSDPSCSVEVGICRYGPQKDSEDSLGTFNVSVAGLAAVCRLDYFLLLGRRALRPIPSLGKEAADADVPRR